MTANFLSMSYLAPLFVAWRVWWANRMPIMDCDEVFNYWEPLHFLVYGNGFQTWEYANEYALRTYAYLMPLVGLSKIYQILIPVLPGWIWPLLTTNQSITGMSPSTVQALSAISSDKLPLFLLLRATLAAAMAWAEISFCQALVSNAKSARQKLVSLTTLGLLMFSAGMSHAAGALLPSSTLTFLWLWAASSFLRERHIVFATLAITATLAIGWPFGVIMFIPIGVAVLWRERSRFIGFLLRVLLIAVVIQSLVMTIDYQQYGKWISPTWNIFVYNTKAGGDELYGIEPWSYYVKNLALNFNYVAVGVLALPLLLLLRNQDYKSLMVVLLPMYIWLAIVFPRPHKEERFLFPIYPSICLGAAVVSVSVLEGCLRFTRKGSYPNFQYLGFAQLLVWFPAFLLSFSRTVALSRYYTAPLQVYSTLQIEPNLSEAVVCTCGEWYRFPSSFYLPPSVRAFGFVKSSFEGQLPQSFTPAGSRPSTLQFNDKNLPEPGSYTLIEECDYLVDLFSSDDCRENDSIWKPVAMGSFLDAERTSTLHRALYIPKLHEQEETRGSVQYVDYILYKRDED